ncbi:MAG TPA: ComEC/Rec2 family competence protein, partial [Gemmatimonadaceae bacterium]
MPLIALATVALIAGLLAGFAGWVAPALLAAALGAGVAYLGRDARLGGLSGLLAAGALIAVVDSVGRTNCRDDVLRSHAWSAVLEDGAAPGVFVSATLLKGECAVHASLAVERGSGLAGAMIRVRGEAVEARHGVKVAHADLSSGGARRSRLLALRSWAGTRIDTIFRADAPLVRALLIADTRSVDPALRDRYAAAGIVHMLSISGLHVAIIAAAMELLFVAARLPRRAALGTALVITAAYVAVIGAPPPALRASVMLGVVTLSRMMQRPTSPWAALALGALVPLVNPRTVLDIGWQLSVMGMASLIASGALARRWIAPNLSGWRANLAGVALASVVASIVSAPLVTWTFGRLSLVAPVTNVFAAPIVAVLQPTLFLALLAAPVPSAARFLAGAAHPM